MGRALKGARLTLDEFWDREYRRAKAVQALYDIAIEFPDLIDDFCRAWLKGVPDEPVKSHRPTRSHQRTGKPIGRPRKNHEVLFQFLKANGPTKVAEAAKRLGKHRNEIYYCLKTDGRFVRGGRGMVGLRPLPNGFVEIPR